VISVNPLLPAAPVALSCSGFWGYNPIQPVYSGTGVAYERRAYSFIIAVNDWMKVRDGDSTVVSITHPEGQPPLRDWLQFDPATNRIYGTPPEGFTEAIRIRINRTDAGTSRLLQGGGARCASLRRRTDGQRPSDAKHSRGPGTEPHRAWQRVSRCGCRRRGQAVSYLGQRQRTAQRAEL
jgi:hypothetical protein